MIHREDPLLRFNVENSIPDPFVVGRANIAFVGGWAFHRRRAIAELGVRVNGRTATAIHAMPRSDVARLHGDEVAERRAYLSGFWGLVPFSREDLPTARVELVATLSNGHLSTRELPPVSLRGEPDAEQPETPAASAPGAPIAICLATYNPRIDLFQRQIESIREQTDRDWICVLSDDRSRPDLYAAVRATVDGDPRFVVSQSPRRLGFYRNFERCLALAPAQAGLIALCDQDDRWHPRKLELLRARLERSGAALAYSDMRVVSADGELISETFFDARRNNHRNLASLMIGNTVTGAASLFRRELLEIALPFPERLAFDFHDHWLASVALATGSLEYVDEPLWDYVQHDANAWGSGGSRWLARDLKGFPTRAAISAMLRRWHNHYFHQTNPLRLRSQLLLLRAGDRLPARKRRVLKRLGSTDQSAYALPVAAWLQLRSLGARLRRWPTMGNEKVVVRGILWRQLVRIQSRLRRRNRAHHRQGLGPAPPPSALGTVRPAPEAAVMIRDRLTPFRLRVDPGREPTLNMVIPTIDVDHFFGAYIGKFNLARRLAESGVRVRLVAADRTDPPADWRERIGAYEGLGSVLDRVEVAYSPGGRAEMELAVSPADSWAATTSWTAHPAHRAARELGRERFLFVIQEYDPLVHPVGAVNAVSREAYELPHVALFSTELLRDYFRRHGLGVYAAGSERGEALSASFRSAITPVHPPSPQEMAAMPPRLLFYARPEAHAKRNMFELGLLALRRAIRAGSFGPDWQFFGVGALAAQRVEIEGENVLEIVPRSDQAAYASLLRQHAVGMALQDTPHPSLVPLEMASAGMPTVTSTFENKGPEEMVAISQNLIPVHAGIGTIAEGLAEAAARVPDHAERHRRAQFDWPRSWDSSFDEAVVAAALRLVEAT